MKLYTGDLVRDTEDLSAAEFGAYIRLIMSCWNHGSIANDPARYSRIARLKAHLVRPLLFRFFRLDRSQLTWSHSRIDLERREFSELSEKKRKAARERHARASDVDMHLHTSPAPTPEKKEKKKEPPPPSEDGPPRNRGARLAVDWTPGEEGLAYAESLHLNSIKTLENFRDYWWAKSGKDATKLDWPATWRRWCRKDFEQRKQVPTSRNGFLELQRSAQEQSNLVDFRERMR